MTYNIDSLETKSKELDMYSFAEVLTVLLGGVGVIFFFGFWTTLHDEKWYLRLSGIYYAGIIGAIAVGMLPNAHGWGVIIQIAFAFFLLIQYVTNID